MDNLDDVRDTQSQAVGAIFRSCGRKRLARRQDDADHRVLLRNRVLHATDARFQHLTLVSTDLIELTASVSCCLNDAVTHLAWFRFADHVIARRKGGQTEGGDSEPVALG